MRTIKCFDIHGVSVDEVLAEFNERRVDEFGIKDQDVISLSVRDAVSPMNVHTPNGSVKSKVVVTLFYWSNK